MKVSIYPFIRKTFFSSQISFRSLLLLFSFFAFINANAKTVVIGSGSGSISQTSMSGLSSGDVLAIAPGTYSGATFSNLNNISIVNNGGVVTFTGRVTLGSSLVNVVISGTGASGTTYGFQFGKPGTTFNDIAISLTGVNTQGLRIYNCEFWNVTNNIVDGSGYSTTYTGDISTLKLYKCTFDHWHTHSSGMIYQGSYGSANQFLVPVDSITVSNMIIDTVYSNGTLFNGGGIYRVNLHDWKVNAYCLNPSGDVGMITVNGNGNINNIYRHGGRGYIARVWGCGLNGPGVTNIYNVIDVASNAYGTVDARVDTTYLTSSKTVPAVWGSDFHILNNTSGNKTDVNGYVCPVVIVGTYLSYKMEIRNNFAFNNQYGANTIINNNTSGGNTIKDTSNNYYLTASQVLSALSDTVNCYLKSGSPLIDKGYASTLVTTDIAGISRPQGSGYDVGAREYSSTGSSVTANAGSSQTITLPLDSVNLSASASTVVNSTISSYKWLQTSGPNTATLSSSTTVSTKATKLIVGTYVFSVQVKDAKNDSSTASVTIVVNPASQSMTLSAGSNQTITLPTSSATLTGTVTDNAAISSYAWTQTTGPNTATIATPKAVSTTVSGLIAGAYVFSLKVTDANNYSLTSTVTITVKAAALQSPVVSAGSNQTITLPTSSVTLTGTATDASGTIKTYAWTQTSGPNTATIASASAIQTNVTGLIAGTYVFQLKATDNNSLSGSGTVTVTVNAASTSTKTTVVTVAATASPSTLTLPTSSTTLTATVSDPKISNPSFTTWWSQQSGPNSAKITSQPKSVTTVTGLVAGTYVFYVSITDPNASANTTVTVKVNSAATSAVVAQATPIENISADTSAVTVVNDTAVSKMDSSSVSVIDDLNASSGKSILLYPNPTSGPLNVQLSSKTTGALWLFVYDVKGNIVFMHQYSKPSGYFSTPIDLSKLIHGTYILQVIIDNKTMMNTKFIRL
ncbi:MAG TPA: choice-of-anchor Q domain-containing protein [Puia sp.]|nr:choice-of-anchor Q domain-containing protein [Puia sp.]